MNHPLERIMAQSLGLLILFCLLGIPVLITVFHIYCLFVRKPQGARFGKLRVALEGLTVLLGPPTACSMERFRRFAIRQTGTGSFTIMKHTPVATWTWPTLLTLAVVGILGYLVLRLKKACGRSKDISD